MAKNNSNLNRIKIKYTKLAYEQASINLGSTGTNPSVGCVVVKNNSVISSGCTSLNGRPHAESNALSKKLNFKNSDMYISLEPCSHHGKTLPCTDTIINKKIKRVIFSVNDTDPRSTKKAERILKKKKIKVKKFLLKNFGKYFYKSYFLQSSKELPFIDAKIALSKDFFTIDKRQKWITNIKSRKLGNFLRSRYNCLLTTSKTVNDDNPMLDCRVEGLEKKTPTLIILDRFFNIKLNLKIFKLKERKIIVFVTKSNLKKEIFLKKKGIKIIKLIQKKDNYINLKKIFNKIKELGFNRILVESGGTFISQLLRYRFIKNFYLFQSAKNLRSQGTNNNNISLIKEIKISQKNKIKVNLNDDSLYKVKL